MDCFRIDLDSKIQHITKDNGVYGEWQEIPGVQSNQLECVSRQVGVIELLSLDPNFKVVSKGYINNKWAPSWTTLHPAGKYLEVPSCTSRTPALVECMTRGFNNFGYYIKQENGKWDGKFLALAGKELTSPFDCGSRTNVDIDCFAVGPDSRIWQRCWNPSRGWRTWFNMGGIVQGQPNIITWKANPYVGIMALERTNGLTYRVFNNRGWNAWVPLGGKFESVPQCVTFNGNKIHCFGIGIHSQLYRLSYDGSKWGEWISAHGTFLKGHVCVITDETKEEVTCLLRGFDRSLVEVVYTLK